MQSARSRAAASTSFVASFVLAWATYRFLQSFGGAAVAVCAYLGAFALGALLGFLFGRQHLRSLAFGAFVAVALLWTPVVLTTYGIALVGVPLLVIFAACLAFGAWLGSRSTQGDARV